ncbi:Jag N-terminal domain-containing protein [Desulforhopalus sp. IMCC35007]|uniref:Jag family protein n=1 Tax=Desulforhopalus sp. IMCC35007 TaxID=2569543 RepID=UPI0010AEB757|nr:Jag N-terminal domain-containing protein [Desulforhopalus sp. IMCC35007]TKB12218.1 RNA-binding protein [Desulforhopalus sp. IMCC35007]
MSLAKKDFYGKEVTDAIKKACDNFGVAQEKLEIDVIETGSTGIFGLIRKKAHIRVSLRQETEEEKNDFSMESLLPAKEKPVRAKKKASPRVEVEPQKHPEPEKSAPAPVVEKNIQQEQVTETVEQTKQADRSVVVEQVVQNTEEPVEVAVSQESLEIVKSELSQIVALMGFPSTIELEVEGLSVACVLRGDFEEELTGVDGKVLDSIQYILRKIVTRKVSEKLRISINVGDFREKRLENLKDKAIELAGQVKEDGKTQVLPALNPSERRAIHMILQEDKEIRSRSVGDGLFKKILIYKPGKNNRGGRKKTQGKGRQNKSSENSEPQSDS